MRIPILLANNHLQMNILLVIWMPIILISDHLLSQRLRRGCVVNANSIGTRGQPLQTLFNDDVLKEAPINMDLNRGT